MISLDDKLYFAECRRSALITPEHKHGIGRLGERTLHRILKYFFEPDENFHEIKVGKFVADICKDNNITEIQTRDFSSLRKKLTAYSGKYNVNVVFPISEKKFISWVNSATGEITSRRKSPKSGKPWDILYELYRLRPIMPLTNVRFTLVMCETEDFKTFDCDSKGTKTSSKRFERIPTEIYDIITLEKTSDYNLLIPPSLGDNFTAAEFAKAAKMTKRTASCAIYALVSLGVIKHTDTVKRTYIYSRIY